MSDEAGDTDLRRRAALMLAMLAVVAALVVVIFVLLLHSSAGGGPNPGAAPDDSYVNGPSTSSTPHRAPTSRPHTTPTHSSTGSPAAASCQSLCVLASDPGNAVGAVNAYRTKHGHKAVPGAVSSSAQTCAKSDGGSCKGAWAETQLPSGSGTAAITKIARRVHLADPAMKSFSVGWAYDPKGHQYFFAIVINH